MVYIIVTYETKFDQQLPFNHFQFGKFKLFILNTDGFEGYEIRKHSQIFIVTCFIFMKPGSLF
jgi:hypothetical protein